MNLKRYPMTPWAMIKNMIEPVIVGSISECDTVTEYLDRIKSQFTGSSKTCVIQLIKQLVTDSHFVMVA